MVQATICTILILLNFPFVLFGQNDHFFTLSNTKARALALGGAFTAIEDDLPAIHYNPAAYLLYKKEDSKRFTIFLNPVSPFIGAFQKDKLYQGSGSNITDVLLSLSLLVKSISLSIKSFEFGILLGEESLNNVNENVFSVNGFKQNHSHSIVGRLKLADKVSLGGTASLFYSSGYDQSFQRINNLGISYGIILKPAERLNIGVSFINLPDLLKQYRLPFEVMTDESINVGLSYRIFNGNLFSIDFRNLAEDEKNVLRQFHVGIEQVLFSHFAARAGYYQKYSDEHVFSVGFGLLNGNRIFKDKYESEHRNFYLNYTLVIEKTAVTNNRWHFFSFLVRI